MQKPWVLGDEMLRRLGPRLPHRWIVADTEFGRSSLFRDRLAKRGERYMFQVPSNILVRKVGGKAGRRPEWHRALEFLKRRPITAWERFTVRDGQKEPIEVIALSMRVQTRRRGKPRVETLLAIESLGGDQRWIFLSNAPPRTPLDEMVKAASRRHLIEEAFENAKGEVGLDHYEVRARAAAPTTFTVGDPRSLSLPAHPQRGGSRRPLARSRPHPSALVGHA